MRDFRMLTIGLVLGFLLTFTLGSKLNNSHRFQPVVIQDPISLIMVDTTTGETKIVMAAGISAQYGKTFNDMVPVPTKWEDK